VSTNSCGRASREWLFQLRFAQSRVAQLDLVPTLAGFASRSAILKPPRFAINYSVRATLVVFAETHRLRTSDVERDQEASRKPSLRCYTGITYSIKSAGQNNSFAPVHSADRSVDCAGSELVVLVFEQDVACMIETRLLSSSLTATHRGFTLITRTAPCSRQLPSCVAVYPRNSRWRRVLSRRSYRFVCRFLAEAAGFNFWNV
jgi:hypothetical protein